MARTCFFSLPFSFSSNPINDNKRSIIFWWNLRKLLNLENNGNTPYDQSDFTNLILVTCTTSGAGVKMFSLLSAKSWINAKGIFCMCFSKSLLYNFPTFRKSNFVSSNIPHDTTPLHCDQKIIKFMLFCHKIGVAINVGEKFWAENGASVTKLQIWIFESFLAVCVMLWQQVVRRGPILQVKKMEPPWTRWENLPDKLLQLDQVGHLVGSGWASRPCRGGGKAWAGANGKWQKRSRGAMVQQGDHL